MFVRLLIVAVSAVPCLHGQVVRLPLSFEANQGQTDAQVQYLVRGARQTIFLTAHQAVLSLAAPESAPPRRSQSQPTPGSPAPKGAALRMTLRNSGQTDSIEAMEPLPGQVNYFIGNDPSRWHTGIPTYGRLAYRGVYPGVDLIYYGTQGSLEYDFVARPGANIGAIQVEFEGATRIRLTGDGDLILDTAAGPVRWRKPHVYEDDHGVRRSIAANYRLTKNHAVGFELALYNHQLPVVIDPVLVYATFLGGSNSEFYGTNPSYVDSTGIYVAGFSYSSNFPTTAGAWDTTLSGLYNVVATKLNPQGSALLYSTYIGGSKEDGLNGWVVGSDGSVYLSGFTASFDYPISTSAYQHTNYAYPNETGFVTHLSATFNSLLYSTFIGGNSDDDIFSMAKDSSGNIYVAGITTSHDYPTTPGVVGFHSVASGNEDQAFVTKLNPTGNGLVYSTYLGGHGQHKVQNPSVGPTPPQIFFYYADSIAVDSSGFAYLAGVTTACDFPTTANAYQTLNPCDAGVGYVVKLNTTATALVYATLLGGTTFDAVANIKVDSTGSVLVAGVTSSTNFPTTPGAYSRTYGGGAEDGFAARLDPTGSTLTYSTYFGGSDQEAYMTGDLASNGNVLLSGLTYSNNLPTTAGTFQTTYGGAGDCFLTVLDPTLSHLVDSTYLGTSTLDDCFAGFGTGPTDILVTGHTGSSAFPTTAGAYRRTYGGGSDDFFLARFTLPGAGTPVLAISKNHTGNFTQGQQGATYTLKVSNTGTGSTGDTVSVAETVPSGLMLVSMTGSNWNCNGSTCSRGDPLGAGSSYPVITVTVNVASGATSPQVNNVSVSLGGIIAATAGDSTVINTFNPSCSFAFGAPGATLPPTGTSTVETCPNNSGQPNCGVVPETPQSFTVTPGAGCGAWTATSSNPEFLQITSGGGTGPGSVSYVLLNNTHNGQQAYTITVSGGGTQASYNVTETGSGDNQVYREVYALYEQLLGRDPDGGGFAFWTGVGGAGLGQMADAFLTSPEAFDSDFAVMAIYQATTNAPPTFAQYARAVASLRSGAQTLTGLFNSLAGAGYNATTLYQNLLNRQPTSAENSMATNAGLANWFQVLIGYPGLAAPVSAANNEFQSTGSFHTDHTNALYTRLVYYVTVSRDPDPDGFNFWLGVANSGGPGVLFQGNAGYPVRIQILGPGTPNQGFIGSPEFQGLFQN